MVLFGEGFHNRGFVCKLKNEPWNDCTTPQVILWIMRDTGFIHSSFFHHSGEEQCVFDAWHVSVGNTCKQGAILLYADRTRRALFVMLSVHEHQSASFGSVGLYINKVFCVLFWP